MENTNELSKKYDAYSHYENLPKLLKRFSFSAKMNMAFIYSCNALRIHLDKKDFAQRPLPWCLETLVMLSMEATEINDYTFTGNNNKFPKMYNAILSAQDYILSISYGKYEFEDVLMVSLSLQQFSFQEWRVLPEYRFWKIFHDNSEPAKLRDIFLHKMGAEYDDFLLLSEFLLTLFLVENQSGYKPIPQSIWQYLFNFRFQKATEQLTITRAEYVNLQIEFAKGADNPYAYLHSLCPSYQYAFVEEEGSIFCPLPHLIIRNVTSSLMFRLTKDNNSLRGAIGKEIWEPYFWDLMKESNQFDEVIREPIYKHKHSNSYGPDIVARQGDNVLFVECKSCVPRLGMRLFDSTAYDYDIDRESGHIVQLYNQIKRFSEYNPFDGFSPDSNDNLWGIVLVQEDSMMNRKYYYKKANEKLKLDVNGPEWEWLCRHIVIVDYYNIEYAAYRGYNLIDGIKIDFKWDSAKVDAPVIQYPQNDFQKNVDAFHHKQRENVINLIEEMNNQGIFQ